jgi:hypothetical protein
VNVNVSGPVRVFALVGALAALGVATWLFLLGGFSPTAASEPVKEIKPLHPVKKAVAATLPAPKPKAKAQPKTAARPAAKAKPKPKALVKPKPAVKPKAVANPNQLPLAVARAFTRNAIVVVSLYDPESKVDRIALGEARAGARRAGVGFVGLNVLDRRDSEALTRKLGVLSAPAFFLFKRPGELVMRIDGFADSELVAQAAIAASPPGAARKVSPRRTVIHLKQWARSANGVCAKAVAGTPRLSANATIQQFLSWGPTVLAAEKQELAALSALALPTTQGERTRAVSLVSIFRRHYRSDVALFAAVKRHERQTISRLLAPQLALGERGNGLAREIGAPACAHLDT